MEDWRGEEKIRNVKRVDGRRLGAVVRKANGYEHRGPDISYGYRTDSYLDYLNIGVDVETEMEKDTSNEPITVKKRYIPRLRRLNLPW